MDLIQVLSNCDVHTLNMLFTHIVGIVVYAAIWFVKIALMCYLVAKSSEAFEAEYYGIEKEKEVKHYNAEKVNADIKKLNEHLKTIKELKAKYA